MNIEQLLKYQEADLAQLNLVRERNAIPEVSEYLSKQKIFNDSKAAVIRINNDSKQTISLVNQSMSQYNDLVEEIDAIVESLRQIKEDAFDDDNTSEEINFLSQNLDELSEQLKNLDSRIQTLTEKVNTIRNEYAKNVKNYKVCKSRLKELTDTVNNVLTQYKPQIDALQKAKETIKKDCPEDVELYERINKAKKGPKPVLIKLTSNTYCGGCMRELSQEQVQAINRDGYAICQECSRIVLKND